MAVDRHQKKFPWSSCCTKRNKMLVLREHRGSPHKMTRRRVPPGGGGGAEGGSRDMKANARLVLAIVINLLRRCP